MTDKGATASTRRAAPAGADDALRAADGRTPGRRGLATRQRLLDKAAELLSSSGYRDLKVVDIAREAGTSPATFYQYFSDVQAALLVLGESIQADAAAVAATAAGDWEDETATALAVVEQFMEFWEDHRSVLRVIDLATEEGDLRFQALRTRALHAITEALAGVVRDSQRAGRLPKGLDPDAHAGVLVAMLAHVSSHRYGFEGWGIRTGELVKSLTRLLQEGVTGGSPSR